MTDIVARLRDAATPWQSDIMDEAAAEIERLRTRYDSATDQAVRYADEIEQLRALLREAVMYDSQIPWMETWWRKARRALEQKP